MLFALVYVYCVILCRTQKTLRMSFSYVNYPAKVERKAKLKKLDTNKGSHYKVHILKLIWACILWWIILIDTMLSRFKGNSAKSHRFTNEKALFLWFNRLWSEFLCRNGKFLCTTLCRIKRIFSFSIFSVHVPREGKNHITQKMAPICQAATILCVCRYHDIIQ